MFIQELLSVSFLLFTVAEHVAQATPALSSPAFAAARSLNRAFRWDNDIKGRLLSDGDQVCYGHNGICDLSSDLDEDCDDIDSNTDPDGWHQCLCESGWAATNKACGWCLDFYAEPNYTEDEYWSSVCSENGLTIAPIPSSILSLQSKFNATNTVLNTGGITNTAASETKSSSKSGTGRISSPTPTQTGHVSDGFSISSRTQRSSVVRSTATTTMFGGNGGAPLTSGQDAAVPTATVTTASGGGAGSSLDTRAVAFLSGAVAALTVMGGLLFQF